MSVAQTLPNIPDNLPLEAYTNMQSNNVEYSSEIKQVRLTSAQLLALKTTPVLLVPAPGLGQIYWMESVTLKYNFLTTAYTLNAGTLKIFYGPVANAHPLTADLSTAFLTAAANRLIVNSPPLVVASDTLANNSNVGLFAGNDGAANYTLGDATVDITIMFGRTTP